MSSTSFKKSRSAVSRRRGAISSVSGRGSKKRDVTMDDRTITPSSGNVFRDLGRANADELLAKAELSLLLTRLIRRQGLTQRSAAELLGVSPPDVSDLMRGKLARFSYERLIRFLVRAGANVAIRVSVPSGRGRSARLAVIEAK